LTAIRCRSILEEDSLTLSALMKPSAVAEITVLQFGTALARAGSVIGIIIKKEHRP
jgi:hypothetical protein